MSDWREISGNQNLRLSQQMLEKQGEINDLRAENKRLKSEMETAQDRLDGDAWERKEAELAQVRAELERFSPAVDDGKQLFLHGCGMQVASDPARTQCRWCAGKGGDVWLPLYVQTPAPEVTGG